MDKTKRSQEIEGRGVYIHPDFSQDPTEGYRQIEGIMTNLAEHNLNFVIPLALGTRCNAYYQGKLRQNAYPWDVIGMITEKAHQVGLRVYPWFCVFPEGDSQLGPVLQEHPQWAVVNKDGQEVGWADPSKPEARRFEVETIMEVVEHYDVDGISLDYLRYGGVKDACYCTYCRSEFRKEYGVDPLDIGEDSPFLPCWDRWREKQGVAFLRELAEEIHTKKPGTEISSYFWTVTGCHGVYQDWPTWVKQGYLDWVNPTGYVYDYRTFRHRCKEYIEVIDGKCPTYITVGVRTSHGELRSAQEVIDQVQIARDEGMDGMVFFTYRALEPYLEEVAGDLFPTKVEMPGR
jgi:uncharacterized lipoprotein YddW (UPF0748 family)